MKDNLTTAERLIVAADFKPDSTGSKGVYDKVLNLAKTLEGTGVLIKINSSLRAFGYNLIGTLHDLDLKVFADLKLIDIPATMEIDGELLAESKPEIVTAMCCSGVKGLHGLQTKLPDTEVLGVTVLTSLDEEECQSIFTCSTKAGVLRFARFAQAAGIGGLILSPMENEVIESRRFEISLSLNNPGIRPEWSLVKGDDQKRVLTPRKAIANEAKRIVIGRPITQSDNPLDAVRSTLEEIEQGLEDRNSN